MYFVKYLFGLILGLWSTIFWRKPSVDDVIAIVEGTSIITLLHRVDNNDKPYERRYYVDVSDCKLEIVSRKRGKIDEDVTTCIKRWQMSYTKSIIDGKWMNTITSFSVNGLDLIDHYSQFSFLFMFTASSTHPKCHLLGNSLSESISSDQTLSNKMDEATWTTRWLHHGLLHGSLGPLTTIRTDGNKWTGLGMPTRLESLVDESHNMSQMGADHGSTNRWEKLDLPLSDFLLRSRKVLKLTMRKHSIPMELMEGIFLSCVVHSIDHILSYRALWGIQIKPEFNKYGDTWVDHFEMTISGFMWIAPTLFPFYNNKISRCRSGFFKCLHKGLKEVDTLNVADEITASIMY